MSTIARSSGVRPQRFERAGAILRFRAHLQIGLAAQHLHHAFAEERMIVHHEDAALRRRLSLLVGCSSSLQRDHTGDIHAATLALARSSIRPPSAFAR